MTRQKLYILLPALLLLGLLAFGLLADFSQYPEMTAGGLPWDKSWEMLGKTVGVEPPGGGLRLQANNSVLAGENTYYASWTAGEPVPYTNEDGEEVDLYPAQLYLLLYGCADEAAARAACEDFLERERRTYAVGAERAATHNGQGYTVLDYTCISENNPYERGCAAFAVRGSYVLVAELACRADFDGDEAALLSDFLDGVHYSAG